NPFSVREFLHQEPDAAESANYASEKRIRASGHGGKNRRRPNLQVAQFVYGRNHRTTLAETRSHSLFFLLNYSDPSRSDRVSRICAEARRNKQTTIHRQILR